MKIRLFLILPLFIASSQEQDIESIWNWFLNGKNNDLLVQSQERLKLYLANPLDYENREVYHYKQTIVLRDLTTNGRVLRCEAVGVYTEQEEKVLLEILLESYNLVVQEVDMMKILSLLDECDSLDASITDESHYEKVGFFGTIKNVIIRHIIPGTKWCGPGNVAKNYHDHGYFSNVDRCCRSHDLCPISLMGGDKRYNLTNNGKFTISHCICDDAFYDCLKRYNSRLAEGIGHFYFQEYSPDCMYGFPELSSQEIKIKPATRKW